MWRKRLSASGRRLHSSNTWNSDTLAAALQYLRASLHGAILDMLRAYDAA